MVCDADFNCGTLESYPEILTASVDVFRLRLEILTPNVEVLRLLLEIMMPSLEVLKLYLAIKSSWHHAGQWCPK